MDALASLSHFLFPEIPAEEALRTFVGRHVEPLYFELFGDEDPAAFVSASAGTASAGSGAYGYMDADNMSVTTSDTAARARRSARLLLTSEGTLPSSLSSSIRGPAVAIRVAEQVPSSVSAAQPARLAVSIGAGLTAAEVSSGLLHSSSASASAAALLASPSAAGSGLGSPTIGRSGSIRNTLAQSLGSSASSSRIPSGNNSVEDDGYYQQEQNQSQSMSNGNGNGNGSASTEVAVLRATVTELLSALERVTAEAAMLRKENDRLRGVMASPAAVAVAQ